MHSHQKKVIILGGPTAVGKTAIAIQWARAFQTEIISADSRQCYRELNIGVARPSPEELVEVPHHFIASHSISEKITAADFEEFAIEKTNEIFRKKDIVIVVGGTGLYLKAFTEGLDTIPEIPEEIRSEIQNYYNMKGLEWLQDEVKNIDPLFYSSAEKQNPQRLMRALEVIRYTGKSINYFRKGMKKQRNFEIIKIALNLPKDILNDRIHHRVDRMFEEGLVEEVRELIDFRQLNALQTVGYKEIFNYLDGKISLQTARELIKTNTRHYAKRQLTWFRKDLEFMWMDSRFTHLPAV